MTSSPASPRGPLPGEEIRLRHLRLTRKHGLSSFRRLAMGSWGPPDDPTVYGSLTVRMEAALAFVGAGHARSVMPLLVRAVALALRACPDANAVLHRGRIYLRSDVSIAVQVASGTDGMAYLRVDAADALSLSQVEACLEGPPEEARPQRRSWLARFRPPDPLAVSAQIAEAGAWGLETAYLPLVRDGGAPIVVSLGPLQVRPCVEGSQVVLGQVAQVHASFDHRFIDGFHASVLARTVRQVLEEPERAR